VVRAFEDIMKSKRPQRGRGWPCAQTNWDDGIDPKELFRTRSGKGDDRKSRQLCKQVYRTLCCLLPGQFSDPLLQDLTVHSVEPAPDASRLIVAVRLNSPAGHTSEQQILDSLQRIRGRIRTEVAAAICRRKAPEIVFRVSPPGGEP
jgi:ribosome-binding factor A